MLVGANDVDAPLGQLRFIEEERMFLMCFYIRAISLDELIEAIVDGKYPPVRQERENSEYSRLVELHGKLIEALQERGSCFQTYKHSLQAAKDPSTQVRKRRKVEVEQNGEDGDEDGDEAHTNTVLGALRERDHDSLSRTARKCDTAYQVSKDMQWIISVDIFGVYIQVCAHAWV